MALERLQKYLAAAGVASRRRAEELMVEGHVAVNGKTVRELGSKIDPAIDFVSVDGKPRPASRPSSFSITGEVSQKVLPSVPGNSSFIVSSMTVSFSFTVRW